MSDRLLDRRNFTRLCATSFLCAGASAAQPLTGRSHHDRRGERWLKNQQSRPGGNQYRPCGFVSGTCFVSSTGQTAARALFWDRILRHTPPSPTSAVPARSRDVGSGTGTPGRVESGPVPNSKTTLVIVVVARTPAVVRTNVPVF